MATGMDMGRNTAAWRLATALALVGGLAAWPSAASAQDGDAPAQEAAPDDDESQYSRFFYIKLLGGYSWADVASINDDQLVPGVVDATGHGGGFGAALGFKVLFLDLGVRGTYSFLGDYNLGGVMADLGLRIPIPVFEPFFRVGLGYGWMNIGVDEVSDVLDNPPDGFLLDLGLGFDVWITDAITIGFDAAWGFYFLNRDEGGECTGAAAVCDVLAQSGSSVAGQLRLGASIGFWF